MNRITQLTSYNILFVDSDPNVHLGHKRMFRVLRPKWKIEFASTAREALTKIEEFQPNILVTELNISFDRKRDLLGMVQEDYPAIVRIVLSSEPDGQSEEVLKATQSAHRFLAKPFKGEMLVEQIEKAADLRRLLDNAELQKIISGVPYLPSLPDLYYELVRAVNSPNISLKAIGDIIAKDVSMTTRVLHLVNSAFFGLPRKVTNPQTAVVFLGINVIKSLVFYVKLFFAAPAVRIPGISINALWVHSSLCAKLSKEIAINLGASMQLQDDAFLAGMLHDIGKLLLLEHPQYFLKIASSDIYKTTKNFADAEYELFGMTHAEVGGYLLGLWGLPDNVVEAVACHHKPSQLKYESSVVLIATHIANILLCISEGRAISEDEEIMAMPAVAEFLEEWKTRANLLVKESRA